MSSPTNWTKTTTTGTSYQGRLVSKLGATMNDSGYTMNDSVLTMGDFQVASYAAPAEAWTPATRLPTNWNPSSPIPPGVPGVPIGMLLSLTYA